MIHLLIGTLFCAADLWCKGKIDHKDPEVARILHRLPRTFGGGKFQIDCVHNDGLAFRFLAKYPLLPKLLSALMFLSAAVLGIPLLFVHGVHTLSRLGLGLMLGGGASNVSDRLRKGYVVDYMNVQAPPVKKLYFNIGDVSILAGFLCLVLSLLFPEKRNS